MLILLMKPFSIKQIHLAFNCSSNMQFIL